MDRATAGQPGVYSATLDSAVTLCFKPKTSIQTMTEPNPKELNPKQNPENKTSGTTASRQSAQGNQPQGQSEGSSQAGTANSGTSKLVQRPIHPSALMRLWADEMDRVERIFDHIFKHHVVHPAASAETLFTVVPPIETWVDAEDKEFHLSMLIPGIKPEALNIILQGNRLTFSGEHKEEEVKTAKNYLNREFSHDRFVRTITLPDGVDGEKLTAELKDGVLEITAPIAAAALPKKIPVKAGPPAKGGGN